ncbi:hypothetical protein GOB87_10905 [Acetobacter estunensis]|uniref:Uncharacterized protein n=1 Tax=Acetobacter estunensis TaxID=104097 RepID=A0A967B8T6_9PROT|nr:hypothetical protein [Acetobacter estunensis]NHO54454.1 hypothetical protein [Acetobacter estunensis]
MAEEERQLFTDEVPPPLRWKRHLSFAPYVAAAVALITIWGVLEWMMPATSAPVPAIVPVRNAIDHWEARHDTPPQNTPPTTP